MVCSMAEFLLPLVTENYSSGNKRLSVMPVTQVWLCLLRG